MKNILLAMSLMLTSCVGAANASAETAGKLEHVWVLNTTPEDFKVASWEQGDGRSVVGYTTVRSYTAQTVWKNEGAEASNVKVYIPGLLGRVSKMLISSDDKPVMRTCGNSVLHRIANSGVARYVFFLKKDGNFPKKFLSDDVESNFFIINSSSFWVDLMCGRDCHRVPNTHSPFLPVKIRKGDELCINASLPNELKSMGRKLEKYSCLDDQKKCVIVVFDDNPKDPRGILTIEYELK